jgi:hypothetical protein
MTERVCKADIVYNQTRQEAVINARKSLKGMPGVTEFTVWEALANISAEASAGHYEEIDKDKWYYGYDEETLQRILFDTRRDAAIAVLASHDGYQQAKAANTRSGWAMVFAFVAMCASVYSALT